MPVYNGEQLLRESLDSILSQTFADFELLISDNGSTDGTEEICKEYTARDRRIRYYRNQHNLGAAWNFNRVVELSTGEYFKWAAADDLCAPSLLSECIKVLDQDSTVILCYSKTRIIDENGEILADYDPKLNTNSPKPHERFRDLICVDHWCTQIFGVMRRSILEATPLIGGYVESDRNLLAELGLWGRFHEVPEYLFFRREHSQRSMKAFPDPQERLAWFDPTKAEKISFPTWKRMFEYLSSIHRVPLSWPERLRCYTHMGSWLVSKSRANRMTLRLLAGDLKVAARQAMYRYQAGAASKGT